MIGHRRGSLRIQYTILIAGILAAVIAALWVINATQLERYAIMRKQRQIKEEISQIQTCADDNFSSESLEALEREIRNSNIDTVIVDHLSDTPYLVYASSLNQAERLSAMQLLFESTEEDEELDEVEVYERTDDYLICRGFNKRMKNDEIECIGYLGEDILYFMSTPLEGIQDSVALSSRFLIYLGLFAIAAGGLVMYLAAGQLTRPIEEMAEISGQAAELTFDRRYEGKENNEIGILGENINLMSDNLSRAIRELREANAQLERDLREKEKVDEMRRLFLSNVSHELKTPIALIQGYAEGLTEGVADDPESAAFYCEVIQDEARKMNQIVRRLLSLDEIESGEMKIEKEVFNVTELIHAVTDSMKVMTAEKDCDWHLMMPEEVFVDADEFMIESVVSNYLSNACHYVSNPGTITVRVLERRGRAIISVHNTGNPIPESELEHIWDKFYKVDKARTRSYGGSGIGLSIVKAVITAHGTRCGVRNRDGGVEFWFELDAVSHETLRQNEGSVYSYME